MITSHIIVPKERTYVYSALYLLILTLIACFAGRAITEFFAWGIPIEIFKWINEELSLLFGIFIAVITAILIWPYIDRTTKFNTQQVYYNPYWQPEVGLVYLTGFHIGNIFEKIGSLLSAIIKSRTTPKKEPLSATCLDDVLQVWGTLTVQERDSRILTLAEDSDKRLEIALEIAWSKVASMIEQFTCNKPSCEILGRSEMVTAFVMERINNLPDIIEKGFVISWTTANMDESEAVKKARQELQAGELFARSVKNLATDPSEMLTPDGKLKPGVITLEESAAIELARRERGSFKRDVHETIIRVEGDPEVLEKLRGHGLLVGTAAAGDIENHTANTNI